MEDLLKGSGIEHLLGNGMTHRESVLKKYNLADKSYSLKELSKASKVPMEILQEVYNRGIGAARTQSTSVRLKGSYVKNVKAPKSAKLSDEQWAYARVYSFLDGNPKHDNDLRRNKEKIGGSNRKAVAFVRKAMLKTKLANDGYSPPAQEGYDFEVAKKLDKPSKHIQMNIGEVDEEDVKKYKYKRTKKSQLSEEEKLRREVMKPEYWGLSWDDFEEVDGELVEKKHGLLWRPIFFKPAGSEKGCWGLRCCRYDKNGNTIPTNKKYEWIYFRDEDVCGDIPISPALDRSGRTRHETPEADPPDEIKNEVDGDEVDMTRYYAKAKNNRFSYRLGNRIKHPFFWFKDYDEKGEDYMIYPNEKPTYKHIPTIVAANNAMRGFMKTYILGPSHYSEPNMNRQEEIWGRHLNNIERVDVSPDEAENIRQMRGRRGRRKTKETYGIAHLLDFQPEEDKVIQGDLIYRNPNRYFWKQRGIWKDPSTDNRWGYIRADKALNTIDDRKTYMSQMMSKIAYVIGANELLIEELIKDPLGKNINLKEIRDDASDVPYGGEDGATLSYEKADVPRLMKDAKKNLPKTEKTE